MNRKHLEPSIDNHPPILTPVTAKLLLRTPERHSTGNSSFLGTALLPVNTIGPLNLNKLVHLNLSGQFVIPNDQQESSD